MAAVTSDEVFKETIHELKEQMGQIIVVDEGKKAMRKAEKDAANYLANFDALKKGMTKDGKMQGKAK